MDPANPDLVEIINPSPAIQAPNFLKLFTIGTLGWVVAFVVLFAFSWRVSNPENLSNAVLWASSRWWISFVVGLLCLVGYGLVTRSSFALAARAYILPAAVIGFLSWLCHLIYPDSSFHGDLVTFLPIIIIFYVFGCIWIMLSKGETANSSFGRAVIPGIVGGLVILGFVAIPVLTGNEFRYRNAFQFTISQIALLDGSIQAEGSLVITKPGHYDFGSPRYFSIAANALGEMDPDLEVGAITWGANGEPKADSLGTFPLKIAWKRALLPATITQLPIEDDSVYLEVRDPNDDSQLIYSLFSPIGVPN